jgi:hypothetical protein
MKFIVQEYRDRKLLLLTDGRFIANVLRCIFSGGFPTLPTSSILSTFSDVNNGAKIAYSVK